MVEAVNRLSRTAEQIQRGAEQMVSGSIQRQIVRLPSDAFLWMAVGSIGGSLFLQLMGKREESLFVGQWAPTFVLLGVLDKLIKIAGSAES
jgi:hypothetical protein